MKSVVHVLIIYIYKYIYCKFINVWEGFIWRISRPSLNRKNKYPTNIIHVPRQLTRPKLTANINPCEHGFVSKTQTLIPANINELTVMLYTVEPHIMTTSPHFMTTSQLRLLHRSTRTALSVFGISQNYRPLQKYFSFWCEQHSKSGTFVSQNFF